LDVPVTDRFDARTARAVAAFQRRSSLMRTARMNPRTWRALLAATR
jgi:peptidoglycan hydrolase-like protein with peptidoglycan-binding domain